MDQGNGVRVHLIVGEIPLRLQNPSSNPSSQQSSMKLFLTFIAVSALAICLLVNVAEQTTSVVTSAPQEINKVCPVSAKPADPRIIADYEEKTYAFATEACRTTWLAAR